MCTMNKGYFFFYDNHHLFSPQINEDTNSQKEFNMLSQYFINCLICQECYIRKHEFFTENTKHIINLFSLTSLDRT